MFCKSDKQILGIAIGSRAIHFAQIQLDQGQKKLTHAALFSLDGDEQWSAAEELGQRIKAFLKAQHFTARSAVVGLPMKWMLTREWTLPPANATAAAGIIRLQIEREYHAQSREWVMDYLGDASPGESKKVLVFAANQVRLMLLTAAFKHAGLEVLSVTSATGALAMLTDCAAMLHVCEHETTLVIKSDAHVGRLVAINWDRAHPQTLSAEIRRSLAGSEITSKAADEVDTSLRIACWSCVDGATFSLDLLRQTVGNISVATPSLESIGVIDAREKSAITSALEPGAVALALLPWKRSSRVMVDFLHSRLDASQSQVFSSKRFSAIAAVLALVCAGLYIASLWYSQMSTVEDLKAQIFSLKTQVADARVNLDRYTLARGWFDTRPALLDELRTISQTFPLSNQVWTTHISMREDLSGTLTGKAESEKSALELYEAMRVSRELTQVKLLYLRQAERGSHTVSFAMTFVYKGHE